MSAPLYHLHIRLDHIEPAIEREFIAPSNLRLDRLHQVIQVVMGWEDAHMHEYILGSLSSGRRFGPKSPEGLGFEDRSLDETACTLAQLAPRKGSRFGYWYDFGDDWHHTLTVRAVLDHAPTPAPLHCLQATGACPPEDSGGPWGYAHLLEVLANPGDEEHEQIREWIGGHFDPAACDLDAINVALARLARRWKLPAASTSSAPANAARSKASRIGRTAPGLAATEREPASSTPLRLDAASAGAFIDSYKSVLLEIAGPMPKGGDINRWLVNARDLLVRAPDRLDDAVMRLRKARATVDPEVLQALRDIRRQRWIYLRDTRSHSIFLEPEREVAYGALGLTQRIRDITGQSGVLVETALLAYRGRIICDGLVSSIVWLGPGARRECTAMLSAARAAGRHSSQALFPPAAPPRPGLRPE